MFEAILVGRFFHQRCCPVRATGGSLPRGRYLLNWELRKEHRVYADVTSKMSDFIRRYGSMKCWEDGKFVNFIIGGRKYVLVYESIHFIFNRVFRLPLHQYLCRREANNPIMMFFSYFSKFSLPYFPPTHLLSYNFCAYSSCLLISVIVTLACLICSCTLTFGRP